MGILNRMGEVHKSDAGGPSADGCGGDTRNADVPAAPDGAAAVSGPPAARRALAEAEARRRDIDRRVCGQPKELDGRSRGRDPARYGDWEVKGIAVDF
jgi:hypothetical protein